MIILVNCELRIRPLISGALIVRLRLAQLQFVSIGVRIAQIKCSQHRGRRRGANRFRPSVVCGLSTDNKSHRQIRHRVVAAAFVHKHILHTHATDANEEKHLLYVSRVVVVVVVGRAARS